MQFTIAPLIDIVQKLFKDTVSQQLTTAEASQIVVRSLTLMISFMVLMYCLFLSQTFTLQTSLLIRRYQRRL